MAQEGLQDWEISELAVWAAEAAGGVPELLKMLEAPTMANASRGTAPTASDTICRTSVQV